MRMRNDYQTLQNIYPFTYVIIFSKAHGMSFAARVSNNNLKKKSYGNVSPMIQVRSQSHAYWVTNDKMLLITFGSPFKNREDKEGGKIKTRMAIAKRFTLYAVAKNQNGNCKAFCLTRKRKKKKKKKNKNYKTSYVTNQAQTCLTD